MAIDSIDRLLCSILRREQLDCAECPDPATLAKLLEAAREHGALPLVDAELRASAYAVHWPGDLLQQCRQCALAQAAYEIAHSAEVERVIAALIGRGVVTLLLKGTGLAYGLYPSPVLRPRTDTDLLVAPEQSDEAAIVLERAGYQSICGPAGRFVGYQTQFQSRDSHGRVHNLDLHWRISNVQSFAWTFSFAELDAASIAVPALGSGARRLGNPHALLVALLHRAATNLFEAAGSGDRLIWFYDMRLLVDAMSERELDTFRTMVASVRVGALAVEGLRACGGRFPSPKLDSLIDLIMHMPQPRSELVTAGTLRREWMELCAIPGTSARLAYLAERAFPSHRYMRERYADLPRRSLAYLHSRRWLEGLGKLVRTGRFGAGADVTAGRR